MADVIPHDRQRMFVILGEMVDDARFLRVQIAATQVLCPDFLARRGLHQRRAGEEDRALIAHDDGLVAHRGHIGAACGAASHHARDLRDALGAHIRSEEHTSELQSLLRISYAVFCLKKKKRTSDIPSIALISYNHHRDYTNKTMILNPYSECIRDKQ